MGKRKKMMLAKKDINDVLVLLKELYPDAKTELNYNSSFELLISTVLSAQCTDKRVNKVTGELYKDYNTPETFLTLREDELGELIRSCGFYRTKSKNILKTCRILIEEYDSQLPTTIEELMKLPGVGRKTANVVASNVFGVDAIAVDTHVFRVSNRIGLANGKDVLLTEEQLMKNIPKNLWSEAHHWLIYHGRRICKARKPQCEVCPISIHCLYYKDNVIKE